MIEKHYAIIVDGVVDNIGVAYGDWPFQEQQAILIEVGAAAIGDRFVNGGFIRNEIPPTPEEIIKIFTDAIQLRLDEFARTRSYDSILSACTYATSTISKFRAEGLYCVQARDATWGALYQILSDVDAGIRPAPSGYQEIEPELPDLSWPESIT